MTAHNRRMSLRGPKFWVDEIPGPDGKLKPTVMFCLTLDSSTRDGPRAATPEDRINHPEAWAEVASEDFEIDPLALIKAEKADPVPTPETPYADRRAAAKALGAVS